jgi:transposase
MTDRDRPKVLTDAQWEVLAPLIEASRPPHKTDHHDLRRTIEAILWRHDNGAKWRQIPAELGPWWMAAQTFSRWSRLGAWERLLEAARRRGGIEAGMAGLTASEAVPRTLDGTSIRAHHKAAGAAKKGEPQQSATRVKGLAVRAAVLEPRLA